MNCGNIVVYVLVDVAFKIFFGELVKKGYFPDFTNNCKNSGLN